jgi:hypothetical protein
MPIYLNVPDKRDNSVLRNLGAIWSEARRQWFVPDSVDATPFLRWIGRKALSAKENAPKVAVIIDGNHVIQARRLRYEWGEGEFLGALNIAIGDIINALHGKGLAVGRVHFHHAAPLSESSLGRMMRDGEILGISVGDAIDRHRIAQSVKDYMDAIQVVGNIPFSFIAGDTQYNGFRMDSRRILSLQSCQKKGFFWQKKFLTALLDELAPEVKQKTVDTRISEDINKFSSQKIEESWGGFVLVATDRDFAPSIENAYKRFQQRTGYKPRIFWAGIGHDKWEDCRYSDVHISRGNRLLVPASSD